MNWGVGGGERVLGGPHAAGRGVLAALAVAAVAAGVARTGLGGQAQAGGGHRLAVLVKGGCLDLLGKVSMRVRKGW